MDIEQLYSLVEKMYREMQEGFHGLNTRMDGLENRDIFSLSINRLANEVSELKLSVDEIKEKMEKVEKVTMQNTYDVAYLKLAK